MLINSNYYYYYHYYYYYYYYHNYYNVDWDQEYIDHCSDVSRKGNKGKPIKMESTRIKNTELGRPELPAVSAMKCMREVSKPNGTECSMNTSGARASKSSKSSCFDKRKSKCSHDENKILWECYIRSITPLPTGCMKRKQQLWVDKGMRELSSQKLAVQVRNIKNKNILSKIGREVVMAYASDQLLNETPLQNFTASSGDTPK